MIPVLLSGGAGTRLWPVSRTQFPKQFCDFFADSLFNQTLKRVIPLGQPRVVTVSELQTLTQKSFIELNLPLSHCIFEPVGKNTAPAVALICKILEHENRVNEIVAFFPADHLIKNESEFMNAVRLAENVARDNYIVTLGIKPNYPATGFGYIEVDSATIGEARNLKAHRTKGFREKPQLKEAELFLKSGNFCWNAGMFVFKVQHMIECFSHHVPDLWKEMDQLRPDLSNLREVYAKVPSISLDYAVMEKEARQACVPCDIGWSDLGSWDDLSKALPSSPTLQDEKSANNFALTLRDKPVAFVGIQDTVVVETADAILVSQKGQTQNVKEIVDQIKKSIPQLAHQHTFEVRPWGKFEILRDEEHFKSKIITVAPHQQLSYQSHTKRAELWIVVKGRGEVVLNDVTHVLNVGEFIHIPLGAKHRMRNPFDEPMEFVEVQTGTYFGEDDIKRYQDDYART